jgi:hypothetical protein
MSTRTVEPLTAALRSSSTASRHRRLALVAAGAAALLSAALGVAALVDRLTGQSLADHATEVYAAHGEEPGPNLLVALVATVAVIGVGLWLLVVRAVRSDRWYAPVLAGAVLLVTATLAVTLLTAAEYGERIFPLPWGGLALLGPAAGAVALVSMISQRRAR